MASTEGLQVGDRVRLRDWDEQGEVIKVGPDGGVWVDTDCNIYRNWSQDAFVKVDPADEQNGEEER
jgi:hypothetical protein